MSNQHDDTDPILETPASEATHYFIERGGRLGLTLTRETKPETAQDHLFMAGFGFIAVVAGVYASGPLGTAILAGGAFTAGAAFERFLTTYRGRIREDGETDG